MLLEEQVYPGLDNSIEFSLSLNNTAIVHTNITRVLLRLRGVELDSDLSPEYFNFTQADRLILVLGEANLKRGRHLTELVVYIPSAPDGLSWGQFFLTVH